MLNEVKHLAHGLELGGTYGQGVPSIGQILRCAQDDTQGNSIGILAGYLL